MNTSPSPSFGALLRQYRRAAGLTQEALAERAGLGRATIDSLERGTRQAPRRETVELLADALQLAEGERTLLEDAARGHRRDAQFPVTLLTPAEPTLPTSPAERAAPAEAVRPPVSQARGQAVTGLLTGKRSAGLISGLLVAVMLGGVLFLTGELGSHPPLRGGTLCLATDFPTTGKFAREGQAMEHAVNLAVRQNQHLGTGYVLKVDNYNDASPLTGISDPSTGAQNVQQMVQNPCEVGLVGPFSSLVAINEMPIAANAGLVMISPSNTEPGLTVRTFAELESVNFEQLHPPGKPLTYFRIPATDVAQVKVDASLILDYLFQQSVYVVNDGLPYGAELANLFAEQFQARGGRIVGNDSLQYRKLALVPQEALKIAAANPDAVFYGGCNLDTSGGLLKAQLVQRGYTGPLVGGDCIANYPDFVDQAGADAANGTYASAAAPDPSTLTSGAAAQFIRDYHAAYPGQDLDGYIANAYDAAMVLITTIKHLVGAGQAITREAVRDRVQHIQYFGVTGPISFDSNGDIAQRVVSIYAVQNGRWVYLQQLSA